MCVCFIISCLSSSGTEKQGVELGKWGGGEDLGEDKGGGTVIRIYCIEK